MTNYSSNINMINGFKKYSIFEKFIKNMTSFETMFVLIENDKRCVSLKINR